MMFHVIDRDGGLLFSTTAVELATWTMNRLDGADRVERSDGALIATRHRIEGGSVFAWLVRQGWLA